MNLGLRGVEAFLKFFEVKYRYSDIITFEEKLPGDTIRHVSISSIPMLQLFFKIILEYYYVHDIPLEYSDKSISDDIKLNLIKKIESYQTSLVETRQIIYKEKAVKMFNLVDFMFKIMSNILKKLQKGFNIWSVGKPSIIRFETTLSNDIDLFFYIVFMHVFPDELRSVLKKELHISSLEDNIIHKCNGIIMKEGKICKMVKSDWEEHPKTPSIPSSPIDAVSEDESYFEFLSPKKEVLIPINKADGFATTLAILSKLRGFSERRRSKMLL